MHICGESYPTTTPFTLALFADWLRRSLTLSVVEPTSTGLQRSMSVPDSVATPSTSRLGFGELDDLFDGSGSCGEPIYL